MGESGSPSGIGSVGKTSVTKETELLFHILKGLGTEFQGGLLFLRWTYYSTSCANGLR